MSIIVQLKLDSGKKLVSVAEFLKNSDIEMSMPISNTNTDSEQLSNTLNSLQYLLEDAIAKNPNSVELIKNSFFSKWVNMTDGATNLNTKEMRNPTLEFKLFCGSDWLTPNGQINIEMARERIIMYAKISNLILDETMYIDVVLKDLMNTNINKIHLSELNTLISKTLFI